MDYNSKEVKELAERLAETQTLSQCNEMSNVYDKEVTNGSIKIRMYCRILGLEPNERETCKAIIRMMTDDVDSYERNLKYLYAYEHAINILKRQEEGRSE